MVYGGTVGNISISANYNVAGWAGSASNIVQTISGGTVSNVSISAYFNAEGSNPYVSQVIFGGNVISTTFFSWGAPNSAFGGLQKIFSGNVSDTKFEIPYGSQTISGGNAYNTSFDRQYGFQNIAGGSVFNTDFTSNVGSQYISAGNVSNTTFTGWADQRIFGGDIYNTNIGYSASQIVSGGNVSFTNFKEYGKQIISGGSVYNTNFDVSASQIISGGSVYNTSFGKNGSQKIFAGNVSNISMSVGNQEIYRGTVFNVSIYSTDQYIAGGNVTSTTIEGRQQYIIGGNVSNTTMINALQTAVGGNIVSTNVMSGEQRVFGSANVTYVSITSGGIQEVTGGHVTGTNINNGSQYIGSGGNVNQTTITSGAQIITLGAFVDNTSILNGATQSVNSGAIVSHTTLLGSRNISGTGYTTSQLIFPGGTANDTLISGGYQRIYSGGTANNTTVNNGEIYALDGANVGNLTLNSGGFLDIFTDTIIQGVVTLNQGGSAQIKTSNGGAINLVGDDNGGLTIIGDALAFNNTSVTTEIQGFSGKNANNSDAISLQYDGLKTGKLSNVTFPDNDHITITMDTGFSLTLNIVGIKQTGYSIQTSSDGGLGLVLTVCFLSGTEIKTKAGVKTIEFLQSGDFVTTYDWTTKKYIEREVTWVGQKHCLVNKSLPDDMAGYPIRIVKGAISNNVPYKDLLITAEHCLFFQDKFIPARMLVNGSTIFYDYSITSYEYYHIETEEHAVIIADGVRTESYLDTGNRHIFNHHYKVIETSLQSAKDWEKDAAAPLVVTREIVEPLYNQLDERAQKLKADYKGRNFKFLEESDLHLVTDKGEIIRKKHISGNWVTFMVPSTAQSVWIKSRRSRLCDVIGPFVDNRHFLGVLVGEIKIFADRMIEFLDVHNEQEDLKGWHDKQIQPGRWTKGNALLPIKSKNLAENSVLYVALEILSEGPYVEVVTEVEDEIMLVG